MSSSNYTYSKNVVVYGGSGSSSYSGGSRSSGYSSYSSSSYGATMDPSSSSTSGSTSYTSSSDQTYRNGQSSGFVTSVKDSGRNVVVHHFTTNPATDEPRTSDYYRSYNGR